jgi:ATP-dependent metalloprotease
MDGFKQTDNIIVIGATNIERALDPAIKRPGRFDKTIHIPLPDVKGRTQIFDYYLKKVKISTNVNSETLARQTAGSSGADIQNIVNIAILNAIKERRE